MDDFRILHENEVGSAANHYNGLSGAPENLQTQTWFKSALIINYFDIPNSAQRELTNKVYKISNNKPLSLLSSNVYSEIPQKVVLETNVATEHMVEFPILCKQLCYKTMIRLSKFGSPSVDCKINRAELWLSGRKVIDYPMSEEIDFENIIMFRQGRFLRKSNSATQNQPQLVPMLVLNHNIHDNPLNSVSGAIPFKNIAYPVLRLYFNRIADNELNYTLEVEHQFYNLVSISGADGSIQTSLSF